MRAESNARTYSRWLPFVPVEGRGAMVKDASGRWLYDCLAAAGAASLGWSHPVVREAIEGVLASGAPLLTLDFPTPVRDAFVEELFLTLPPEFAHDGVVHFCGPGGANAVEAALLLAETATGGVEHVALEGGFHGCSRGAREVSSGGGLRSTAGSLDGRTRFLPFPQAYRCPFNVGGDESARLASLAAERLFLHPHSALTRPASIVLECVQGEAGSLPAPASFLRTLRTCATRRGIPLIADEVQAGVYRSGTCWSFEHGGIVPDIVVASKGLGAGVPIAVIVMRKALNVWGPSAFTGTFRGNALAFAVGAATLRFLREQDLAPSIVARGEQLLGGLREMASRSSTIGDVRGKGLMVGVEIVDPDAPPDVRGVRPPDPARARALQRACFDAGVLVEVGGAYDNVIRMLPPLTITADEVDTVLELFSLALRECEARAA